jgi:hypothetical protein
MDWLERRHQKERERRLRRVAAYGVPAIGLARWGLYGPAAANARETARLVRPLSSTLAVLWDTAADAWERRARPPLRLFEDDELDG